MHRRTKWVLGVTVALVTAASLRFTAGHRHWHHRHYHGQHQAQCESRWHNHNEKGPEKPQVEASKNQ
ncbi:hypothetical protein [Runella slithyformis]|uniref:hypothetical protein n=1 Tax=Runella slithyformis TaxID=106 RepID=UPI00059C609B|nr:hypothetical protein [Runella slithyformis]